MVYQSFQILYIPARSVMGVSDLDKQEPYARIFIYTHRFPFCIIILFIAWLRSGPFDLRAI